MRILPFFLLTAPMFLLPKLVGHTGHFLGMVVFLGLSVAIATAASGYRGSLPVAGGALAALACGLVNVQTSVSSLGLHHSALACAVFFALVFGERTLRIRSNVGKGLHIGLALVGGLLGGFVVQMYLHESPLVFAIASSVAVAAAGLPLLVDADDPVAHHLTQLAAGAGEPAKAGLLRAAELRRAAREISFDTNTDKDVGTIFRALGRLGEARTKLQGSATSNQTAKGVLGMLDAKIAQSVAALEKTLTATLAVSAAEAAKDDGALANVEARGAGIEEATQLLAELDAELASTLGAERIDDSATANAVTDASPQPDADAKTNAEEAEEAEAAKTDDAQTEASAAKV